MKPIIIKNNELLSEFQQRFNDANSLVVLSFGIDKDQKLCILHNNDIPGHVIRQCLEQIITAYPKGGNNNFKIITG